MDGTETFDITGIAGDGLTPLQDVTVTARGENGEKTFTATVRIDTPVEVDYYRNGGILHTVLRNFLKN